VSNYFLEGFLRQFRLFQTALQTQSTLDTIRNGTSICNSLQYTEVKGALTSVRVSTARHMTVLSCRHGYASVVSSPYNHICVSLVQPPTLTSCAVASISGEH